MYVTFQKWMRNGPNQTFFFSEFYFFFNYIFGIFQLGILRNILGGKQPQIHWEYRAEIRPQIYWQENPDLLIYIKTSIRKEYNVSNQIHG